MSDHHSDERAREVVCCDFTSINKVQPYIEFFSSVYSLLAFTLLRSLKIPVLKQ